MPTRLGLQQRPSTQLALTPQMQHSIRMLHMSALELQQEVAAQLQDNPLLEYDTDESESSAHSEQVNSVDFDESQADGDALSAEAGDDAEDAAHTDWEWSAADSDAEHAGEWAEGAEDSGDTTGDGLLEAHWPDVETQTPSSDGDFHDEHPSLRIAAPSDWRAQIRLQAAPMQLTSLERDVLEVLIDSLDDEGYLREPWDDWLHDVPRMLQASTASGSHWKSASLAPSLDDVHAASHLALQALQSMEPTGIGARNLVECLQLQLRERLRHPSEPSVQHTLRLALRVCEEPLEWLAEKAWDKLCNACLCKPHELQSAVQLLRQLKPRPLSAWATTAQIVIPDVIVQVHAQQGVSVATVHLNEAAHPRLRVHPLYAQWLQKGPSNHRPDSNNPLQDKLLEARNLVRMLGLRSQTVLRVAEAIVERQQRFFIEGLSALHPMVMRDVAEALGMHESTISRVCNGKYMQARAGTYEFRFFFTSALKTDAGFATSSAAVRDRIAQWIASEDPQHPLSDQDLANRLLSEGIQCARRTVAKYREMLNVPGTNARRQKRADKLSHSSHV